IAEGKPHSQLMGIHQHQALLQPSQANRLIDANGIASRKTGFRQALPPKMAGRAKINQTQQPDGAPMLPWNLLSIRKTRAPIHQADCQPAPSPPRLPADGSPSEHWPARQGTAAGRPPRADTTTIRDKST